MKKFAAITTLSLALIAHSNQSLAATTVTEAKQGATFATTTIVGTIIGGPVGFVVGALAGGYLGEEIKQADEATTSLTLAEEKITALEEELVVNQALLVEQTNQSEPYKLQLESLPMRVFFSTNSDQLNTDASSVVDSIAEVLLNNPDISIELTGHTDPRGNDDYNNVLSQYRAKAVKDKLIEMGVEEYRIDTRGEGENYSQAPKGDREAYALERRVDIDFLTDGNSFVSRF
ncbi:OmpA family protein [Sessilibacter corallicola]|uniref:OmpA-like domain-containing protein n=1 Tax=Sessilibacter corallicola TaxID=2904075 RepID=A0ABQ0A7D1_9GAMM|nr:OmpA family protein [Sessilibacter corallicola]MCE2028355.1 OmpA family protein [Sessilibacter corallicola]